MITMMVGIPASGKSTWAKQYRPNSVIVSTDAIREELWGDASVQKNNRLIFETAFQRINEAVANGNDVVFDATNITIQDRKRALNRFPKGEEVEAVVMCCDLHTAVVRNLKRERVVPVPALVKMSGRYQPVHKEEGFTDVLFVSNSNYY